jgi:hypothetical protein
MNNPEMGRGAGRFLNDLFRSILRRRERHHNLVAKFKEGGKGLLERVFIPNDIASNGETGERGFFVCQP